MHVLFTRLRRRLTFANVTSCAALFIALGGTSYAAISVGSAQIRTGAVGKSEIRTGAVGKSEIRSSAVGKSEIASNAVGKSEIARDAIDTIELKDGGIDVADLSAATRSALTLSRVSVAKSGAAVGGSAKSVSHASGSGVYTVEFDRDVSACTPAATLAAVKNGATVEQPTEGHVAVAPGDANTRVVVNTFGAPTGAPTPTTQNPADQPFTLLVAC
jgi:hypothetical protein